MKIDSDMVEYLANLSRLNLSEKEKSEMQIELKLYCQANWEIR